MSQPIAEEYTSYVTLLYRKMRWMRYGESIAFVFGLIIVIMNFPFRSFPFFIAVFSLAFAVFFGAPLIYKYCLRPYYLLYPDRLQIGFRNRTKTFSLKQIKKDFDLSYIYVIENKRESLLVSNQFLEKLNGQLEVVKHG
ncbi:hypothetical protein [Thermoactinomyces mirandus]|uniref:Uncharacterized protein n=1 Tax=Thermoactinomyces mirandus TaxID=2756294 RepID=A0A7W1XUC3_9BACL|nr:hypothetical protein [Thermoactinomyces mirandus]MBA4603343.1 hypothetical protein [Thermoactinomyces mirandus]